MALKYQISIQEQTLDEEHDIGEVGGIGGKTNNAHCDFIIGTSKCLLCYQRVCGIGYCHVCTSGMRRHVLPCTTQGCGNYRSMGSSELTCLFCNATT